MGFPQAGDRTWHAHGFVAKHAALGAISRDHLAFAVDEHVPGRLERCPLAVVKKIRFTLVIDRHEPTTTNVPRFRIGNG
ncbi:hypothetical protein D3C84_762720 [compost metagenome]